MKSLKDYKVLFKSEKSLVVSKRCAEFLVSALQRQMGYVSDAQEGILYINLKDIEAIVKH